MSPSSSNFAYTGYPPFPAEWTRLQKDDFPANQPARDLAHQARSVQHADWPELKAIKPDLKYLNGCRALANELGDAALFQHMQGDDAAAVETLRDQLQLADSLESTDKQYVVMVLVSVGIRAMAMDRLMVITGGAHFTKDAMDNRAIQIDVAKQLIKQLTLVRDPRFEMEKAMKTEIEFPENERISNTDKMQTTCKRVNAECGMAAISLACHLAKLKNNAWPSSSDDLRPYLPNLPIDPFGDGKLTLGYTLVKAGLPDGTDRPLAYSRGNSKDGLFFRTDIPAYSRYSGDGTNLPAKDQKQGGQFRDITAWVPTKGQQPSTQPLKN